MFRPARGRSVVPKRNTGQRVAQRQSTVLLFRDVACMSATAPELRLIRAAFRSPLPTPAAAEYTGHRNAAPLPVRQCRGRSRPADVADSAPAATSGRCCRYILFTCIVYHIPPLFASGCRKVTYSFTAPAKNNCAFLYGRSSPPLPAFFLTTLFRLFASGPAYRLLCAARHASPSAIPLR